MSSGNNKGEGTDYKLKSIMSDQKDECEKEFANKDIFDRACARGFRIVVIVVMLVLGGGLWGHFGNTELSIKQVEQKGRIDLLDSRLTDIQKSLEALKVLIVEEVIAKKP